MWTKIKKQINSMPPQALGSGFGEDFNIWFFVKYSKTTFALSLQFSKVKADLKINLVISYIHIGFLIGPVHALY